MSTATDGGATASSGSSSPAPPPILLPPRANAIATLLTTDDFLPGAQTLLYSLKENLKTPKRDYPPEIIVLVTPSISAETRTTLFPAFCTRLVEVDPIPFPDDEDGKKAAASSGGGGGNNSTSHVKSWNENCGLTKLHIFGMDVYDTILYIDADCVVIQDVTHLLSVGKKDYGTKAKQRGALVAASPDIFPPDKFNAGVMVLRPSSLVLEDMLLQCKTLVSYDGGDTGFLNAYFSKWYSDMPNYARLSFGCNAQRFLFDCTYEKQPNYWDLAVAGGKGEEKKLMIVHYSSSPKPWEENDVEVPNGKEEEEGVGKGKETAMSHLNVKDVEKLVKTRGKKKKDTKLDKLWQTWYQQSTNYASQFQRRQIEEEKEEQRKKRKKLGGGSNNQQRQPPPSKASSALESHKVITKRYQELRKGGMSTKDAMAAARAEFGADKDDDHDDDPGKKVAAMFGMQ